MKVRLAHMKLFIGAPRELVFQMISAIGKGRLPGGDGESSRVLEREGNTLIAEFYSRSGKRIYRTLERVELYPPERLSFSHLEGPLTYSEEEFVLVERDGGMELQYRGEIECKLRFGPGLGWLTALLYVRPKYNALIRDHMDHLKDAAEARAARSHVFRQSTRS